MIQTEIKAQRSFVDPFYKSENKGSYFLSVQLGRDALYLAVLDLKNNTYFALEEYLFEGIQNAYQLKSEFEKHLEKNVLLKMPFEKVVFGIINEYNSLVPEALYDEKHRTDYFEFTQGKQEDYIVLEDVLTNIKARNLYAIPKVIYEAVQMAFPSAQIRHASSALIDGLCLMNKQEEGEKMQVHVQYSHFEMLYFQDGRLQFFNSFNYTTAEDFIYYFLFSCEQLGLNMDKLDVKVFGEIDEDANTYGLLYKYVRNVSFGGRSRVLKYSNALDMLAPNHYYNLFQQYLCV